MGITKDLIQFTGQTKPITASSIEAGQAQLLNTAIGSVTKTEASSLVNSPVPECELGQNCQSIDVNSKVGPIINKIYGIK